MNADTRFICILYSLYFCKSSDILKKIYERVFVSLILRATILKTNITCAPVYVNNKMFHNISQYCSDLKLLNKYVLTLNYVR